MMLDSVDVLIENKSKDFFSVAKFNELEYSLEFELETAISHIKVTNETEELEYQLPVLTRKIQLGKSLFPKCGNYKIGFRIEGQKSLKFSDIRIR